MLKFEKRLMNLLEFSEVFWGNFHRRTLVVDVLLFLLGSEIRSSRFWLDPFVNLLTCTKHKRDCKQTHLLFLWMEKKWKYVGRSSVRKNILRNDAILSKLECLDISFFFIVFLLVHEDLIMSVSVLRDITFHVVYKKSDKTRLWETINNRSILCL